MRRIGTSVPRLGMVFASPRRVTWVLSGGLICGAALLLALAALAHAGRYHAYSCRTPSGGSAPVDGWSGSTSGVHFTYVEDTCSQGGGLVAALGDQPAERQANADVATWALTVPSPETVAMARWGYSWRRRDQRHLSVLVRRLVGIQHL